MKFESAKTLEIPNTSKITEEMVLELIEWVDEVDIFTFRRNLRMLTFYFLNKEHQELSAEFQVFMQQLPAFFNFLDVVEGALPRNEMA